MKSLSATLVSLFFALALVPFLSAAAAQTTDAAPASDPRQKLFEIKCQKCHSPERVKEAHLTIDMVKPTVDRMRSKPGADISAGGGGHALRLSEQVFRNPALSACCTGASSQMMNTTSSSRQ